MSGTEWEATCAHSPSVAAGPEGRAQTPSWDVPEVDRSAVAAVPMVETAEAISEPLLSNAVEDVGTMNVRPRIRRLFLMDSVRQLTTAPTAEA